MEFLETVTLAEAVVVCVGLLTVVGLLLKGWPFVRRLVHMLDALDALPALANEMRDAIASVATMGGKVDTIHHEVTPNGGGSMKDELRRQSETLGRLDRQQLELQAGQRKLEETGLKRDEEIQGVRAEQDRVAERLKLQALAIGGALTDEPPPTSQEHS